MNDLKIKDEIAAEMDPDQIEDAECLLRFLASKPKWDRTRARERHRITLSVDGNTLALLDHIVAYQTAQYELALARGEAGTDPRYTPSRANGGGRLMGDAVMRTINQWRQDALEYVGGVAWCDCGNPCGEGSGWDGAGEAYLCPHCLQALKDEDARLRGEG